MKKCLGLIAISWIYFVFSKVQLVEKELGKKILPICGLELQYLYEIVKISKLANAIMLEIF
jgi:hypothetical protein